MQNGLALQAGTSHDFGQNFGRAFDVQFQTNEGKRDYVWQTSWGVSTRLIGGLIMTHSDDKGLVLPPKVAPCRQCWYRFTARMRNAFGNGGGAEDCERLEIKLDSREGQSPGAKFFHWERRGVPIVLELGPRDLASGNVVLKRRDTGSKEVVPQSELGAKLEATLAQMQMIFFSAAKDRLKNNCVTANSLAEVEEILKT